MPRLKHRPALDGAFSHDGESYRIEDGIIEVDDEDIARDMAEHPRIELVESAESEETPTPDAAEPPFFCGINDCSREVDSPDETCWQHSDD